MKKLDKFYEEFDKDSDRLYQEEVAAITGKKSKKRLKYPESFYDHWKEKTEEFIKLQVGLELIERLEKQNICEELAKVCDNLSNLKSVSKKQKKIFQKRAKGFRHISKLNKKLKK